MFYSYLILTKTHLTATLQKHYGKYLDEYLEGPTSVHFKKRKPSKDRCAKCDDVVKGVSRERSYKIENMTKTKNRSERRYGGTL